MKTARLRRFAFGAAISLSVIGGFAATLITDPQPVVAQDSELAGVKEAVADYKRGNYRAAAEKLTDIMSNSSESGRIAAIREEVGLALAREFVQNNLADQAVQDQLVRVGLWLQSGYTSSEDTISGFSRIWQDQEGIQKFVDAYMTEANPIRREERGAVIRDKYGEFAVPFIRSKYMHDANADVRTQARGLLRRIGYQAVPALIQVMRSGESLDQETAAKTLGDIGDGRALPVLKEFYETSEDAEVRDACASAIRAIPRPAGFATGLSARDAWLWQAESYYSNEGVGGRSSVGGSSYQGDLPVLIDNDTRSYTVWRWMGDEADMPLEWEEVPLWNYADVMAEECVLRAYELTMADMGDEDRMVSDAEREVLALYACICAHQYSTGTTRFDRGSSDEKSYILSLIGESMVDGATRIARFSHMLGSSSIGGSATVMAAIDRSLTDGYPLVTVELCNALIDLRAEEIFQGGVKAVMPLVKAMRSQDKRVRYSAARAVVALVDGYGEGDSADDTADSGGSMEDAGAMDSSTGMPSAAAVLDMAMNTFVNSLDETSFRSILLIAEDEAVRTKYYSSLRDLRNYSINVYDNVEDGMNEALKGTAYDYILLDYAASQKAIYFWNPTPLAESSADAAREVEMPVKLLRTDSRTMDTPLLLIVPDSQAGRVRNNQFEDFWDVGNGFRQRDSVLSYTEGVNFAEETLTRALDVYAVTGSPAESRWKRDANEFVVQSCDVIVDRIDPNNTVQNMDQLLNGLSASLAKPAGRTEAARLALTRAIIALSNYEGMEIENARLIVDGLVARIMDGDEFAGVKGPAGEAIGELCRNHPSIFSEGSGTFQADTFDALLAMTRLQADDSRLRGGDSAAERARLLTAVQNARNAAGMALGKLQLTKEQKLAWTREARASRHLPLESQGNPQKDRFGGDN